MIARSKDGEFTLAKISAEMKARNSAYSERTIRTHVTSRMCANAPKNHAIVYNDFWCVDRGSGRYRLFNPETNVAVRLRKTCLSSTNWQGHRVPALRSPVDYQCVTRSP